MIAMYNEGHSQAEVAKAFGLTHQYTNRILKRCGAIARTGSAAWTAETRASIADTGRSGSVVRWGEPKLDAYVADYQAGRSVAAIAIKHGRVRSTIFRALRKAGFFPPKKDAGS